MWHAIGHALSITGSMTWEITWALILGFTLSAVVQAVVRRSTIVRLLGDDRPRTLALASGLGVASSSCSYAAVALARSLFRKGANFTAAMAFEIASTNLVIELGVILALLMGWQFTLAEFVGGPLMIVILAVLFRVLLRERAAARGPRAGRAGAGGVDGGARGDGHVGGGRGRLPTAAADRQGLHVGGAHLRHGVGRDHAGPGGRPADRGRDRRLGAGRLLAHVLPVRPPARGQAGRAARRAAGGDRRLRLLHRERAAGGGAVEGRHQLRRA